MRILTNVSVLRNLNSISKSSFRLVTSLCEPILRPRLGSARELARLVAMLNFNSLLNYAINAVTVNHAQTRIKFEVSFLKISL